MLSKGQFTILKMAAVQPYRIMGYFCTAKFLLFCLKNMGIIFFADFNFRSRQHPRNIILTFFSAKIVECGAQLDFPSIEQLCGKKILGQSI